LLDYDKTIAVAYAHNIKHLRNGEMAKKRIVGRMEWIIHIELLVNIKYNKVMVTKILRHGAARKVILKGVNEIYNTVKFTLGPEYGTVLLHRSFNRGSRITNDGVTIAKCIEPRDKFEKLVATAFKESAAKTGERAGDGTTSTIVIAGKMINDAFSLIGGDDKTGIQVWGLENKKTGAIALKKHILETIPKIKEAIGKQTKKIETQEELFNIADVSLGGNKDVAKIVSDMIWKTGNDGFITLGDSFKGEIETEIIEGARFPMKIAAKLFMNNPERYEMVASECECLITNYELDNVQDFLSFWNSLKRNKLIIFAPKFSEEVLNLMAQIMYPNRDIDGKLVPSGIKIFPVKCASLGSEEGTPNNFLDLAAFCDATFINKNEGKKLKDIKEYDLGFLEKMTIKSVEDKEDATLLGGRGCKTLKVGERILMLREQIKLTKLPEHKKYIEKRIASLASVGGMIRVGAPTDAEALPLKHKIEDAIFACQQALKYGYVKGGGLCLKEIAEELFKDDILIRDALCAPYNQIQENVGSELKIEDNIIDPAKVVELEVEHGFGVAANLITCKAVIPEFDDRDDTEGYKLVADAIGTYVYYFAKREGLLQSGTDEAKREQLERWENMISQENSD
jgi:chaperonin GroEL